MLKHSNIRLIPVLVWLVLMLGSTLLMIFTNGIIQILFPDVAALLLQFVVILLAAFLPNIGFARFTTWWLKRHMMGAFLRGDFELALHRLNIAERYMVFASQEYMTIQRLITLGAMLRLQEARELALSTIQRVDDETDERHRVALLTLAEIAHTQKQYSVAIDYLTRLVDMKSNFVHINLKELGILNLKMGKPEQALKLVNESLELLADTEYTEQNFKNAPQDIKKVIGRTEAAKAWILASGGHVEEALDLLQKSFPKVEDDNPPFQAIFHLYAGRAYQAMNNLDEAQQHLQKAADLDPQGITGVEAREILTEIGTIRT